MRNFLTLCVLLVGGTANLHGQCGRSYHAPVRYAAPARVEAVTVVVVAAPVYVVPGPPTVTVVQQQTTVVQTTTVIRR